jgi:hypothetical protein
MKILFGGVKAVFLPFLQLGILFLLCLAELLSCVPAFLAGKGFRYKAVFPTAIVGMFRSSLQPRQTSRLPRKKRKAEL